MASTVTELMRRRFRGTEEVDPLDGWTLGYRLNMIGEVSSDICCISPYLNAAAGSTVSYCNPQTSSSVNKGIWTYDENLSGSYLQWAVRDAGVNSFMMPQGRTKFRITMYVSAIDNSYIMDENGNYIWKGKNV